MAGIGTIRVEFDDKVVDFLKDLAADIVAVRCVLIRAGLTTEGELLTAREDALRELPDADGGAYVG